MGKCPICGIEIEYGDAYLHQACEFALSYGNKSPEEKMRKKWERMSKKISPVIFQRDGNRCINCGATEHLTVDHIIPIHKGGTNEQDNLQTLCGKCNSSKGAKI